MGNGWGFNSHCHTTDWRSPSHRVRADVGGCERMSMLFRSRQRYPAMNRPFDEWRAGGDGDELQWELSRPKSILKKKRRGKPDSQRSSSSDGHQTRDDQPRASASIKCYCLAREQKRLIHVLLPGSPSHTSHWVSLKSRTSCTPMPPSEGAVDRCEVQSLYSYATRHRAL